MNERLTYEELIAAKLEQLSPLPAMADAIWSRISDELDREMPADEGGPNGGGGLPGTGGWIWPGIGLIVLAVAGLLYWNTQRSNLPAAIPENLVSDTGQVEMKTGRVPIQSEMLPDVNKPTRGEAVLQVSPSDSIVADENIMRQGLVQRDTNAVSSPAAFQNNRLLHPPAGLVNNRPVLQPVIDSPASRKPKGVIGISDSDYRIVPDKKDTGSKKNQ